MANVIRGKQFLLLLQKRRDTGKIEVKGKINVDPV
jgi:hypothetical protein